MIQDYVFSTSAIIACGFKRHDAPIIDSGFTALSLFFNDAIRRGILSGCSSEHPLFNFTTRLMLVNTFLSRRYMPSDRETLLGLLYHVTGTGGLASGTGMRISCSEPRDFVYAFYALVSESPNQLKARLWKVMAGSLTAHLLASTEEFVLMYAGLRGPLFGLPSWVPKWLLTWDQALWRPIVPWLPVSHTSEFHHRPFGSASGLA